MNKEYRNQMREEMEFEIERLTKSGWTRSVTLIDIVAWAAVGIVGSFLFYLALDRIFDALRCWFPTLSG